MLNLSTKNFGKLIILGGVYTICSCASFSKKGFRKIVVPLSTENKSMYDGKYQLHSKKELSALNKTSSTQIDTSITVNVVNLLTNQNKLDSAVNNTSILYINFTSRTIINLKVEMNNIKIIDTLLQGKFKNGMFYLNNNFLKCNGIPFILGGCQNNKRRIGFTKMGNLLVNEAVSNEGAFLLLFGSGYSYNVTYEFKKL